MPPDAPLPNSDEARTPTGDLKDQSITTTTESKTEPTKTEPETKLTEVKEGETLLGEKKEAAKAEVPEKYEFTAPADWKDKGWELDPKVIEKATPLFKELGLTQDAAQKLVNLYAEQSVADHQAKQGLIKEQSDAWLAELKADPEIGGKLDAVKERVGRMYDAVDPKLASAFKEQMNLTGIGNHPAFVKFLNAIADKFSEGKPVTGRGPVQVASPNGRPESAAKAIYPNLG